MLFKVLTFATLLASSISFKTYEKKFLDGNIDSSDKTIYVDISLNESLKDNDPYLHYVNGDNEQNINLILDNDFIYHTESNISFDGDGYYEICCSTGFVTNQIDKNYLSKNNYNYVCVGQDNNIQGYGYFGDRLVNPGATYKTQRVWLYNANNGFTIDDDWGSKRTTTIGYYFDNKWNVMEMPNVVNTYDEKVYYYADIPANVTSVIFTETSNNNSHKFLVYRDFDVERLSYGVCYSINTEGETPVFVIAVEGADATLLSMVVEPYLAYSKDLSNGCSSATIKTIFTTWFEKKSASTSDLKNAKILDYTGYASNGYSYEGLEKNASFSVNEKWNTMCSQAGIDPKTGKAIGVNLSWLNGNTGKFIVVVGGVATVVSLGTIAFIVFKKKRKKMALWEAKDFWCLSVSLIFFFLCLRFYCVFLSFGGGLLLLI